MYTQMLQQLKVVAKEESGNSGVYEISPLPTGYGNTLGNALRRVLLSSVQGAAITSVSIVGVDHQFSTIKGIREDVLHVLLNCKEVCVKIYGDNPVILKLNASGEGKVTAKDFEIVGDAEIANKDLVIATLTDAKAKLSMEATAKPGVGYVPASERGKSSRVGELMLDAVFTPVVKAAYSVEATRVGGKTDLDKLVLSVETDGTISPRFAMESASGILVKFFCAVGNIKEEELVVEAPPVEVAEDTVKEEGSADAGESIDNLNFTTRTINALSKGGIATVEDLLDREKEDLLALRGFGETALDEVNEVLKGRGMTLK